MLNRNLNWGLSLKQVPIILQTEATECGLACVAMIANYYGNTVNLKYLRLNFPVSLKGMNLGSLTRVFKHNGLSTRPLRTSIGALKNVKLPCVLHWNFNHFVVLIKINNNFAIVIDPALGERKIPLEDLSNSFTGIVLEVWPANDFKNNHKVNEVSFLNIFGHLKGYLSTISVVLILAFSLEFMVMLTPFFIQLVIDDAISSNDLNLLSLLAIGFFVIYFIKNIINIIRSWFLMYLGNRLNLQWKENILTHLFSLPIQYFEKRHVGDITSRVNSIDNIQRVLTTSFIESFLDGIMSFIIIIILFMYSPLLASIVIFSMFLYFLVRWFWNYPMWEFTKNEIIYNARQQTYFLETIRGIKTIKLFNKEMVRRNSWISLFVDQINAKLSIQKLDIYYKGIKSFIFDTQNIIIIWLGASIIISKNLSIGSFMAFLGYKVLFDTRVTAFIDNFFLIKNLKLQYDRLSDIVDSEIEDSSSGVGYNFSEISASVEFKNVKFQYALYERNVLDDLSFKVYPGESVAIIGPTGCGKSTIFNLILGIFNPNQGQLLLGGHDIKTLGIENIRNIIGTVLQDDVLFAGSISDNISFFDSNLDEEWLVQCAKIVGIDDDISEMPMKYYTFVGDMGTILSGGQKQRILLARALYKKPKILLLDEATSSLDLLKERLVSNNIKKLKITRLIIAHRPETILSADRILLMKNGRIQKQLRTDQTLDIFQEFQ